MKKIRYGFCIDTAKPGRQAGHCNCLPTWGGQRCNVFARDAGAAPLNKVTDAEVGISVKL